MALAQDDESKQRLYSTSSQIIKKRDQYYDLLENTQKGKTDLTQWILFFLEFLTLAIEDSQHILEKTLQISRFWSHTIQKSLNERQVKAINKLLDSKENIDDLTLSNKDYVSITHTSRETAKRDLSELVEKKVLTPEGKGRSFRYRLGE